MSDSAEKIITSLQNGKLPPLKTQKAKESTQGASGIQTSQRGLELTKFGLQSITEKAEIDKD